MTSNIGNINLPKERKQLKSQLLAMLSDFLVNVYSLIVG